MVMSLVHLSGQIQLPISPSLALEEGLGVGVLEWISMSVTWRVSVPRTGKPGDLV